MVHEQSLTGIPIEYLFTVIGGLITLVYLDVKRELKALRKNAEIRGGQLVRIGTILRIVCSKLRIPYGGDRDDDDDYH